jgi:hypothetical protein
MANAAHDRMANSAHGKFSAWQIQRMANSAHGKFSA